MADLFRAAVDAPVGTLLALGGLVLLLVAAGLKVYFQPDKPGRIFAGIVGTVLVAAGTFLVIRETPEDTSALLRSPCSIAGTVFNHDTTQPLAGVELYYQRTTEDRSEAVHDALSRLAETAPNGTFSFDCSRIEPENLPTNVLLRHPAWRIPAPTRLGISVGSMLTEQNVWISDSAMKKVSVPAGFHASLAVPLAITQPLKPAATATVTANIDGARLQPTGIRGFEVPTRP